MATKKSDKDSAGKKEFLAFINQRKSIAEKWTKEKYIDQACLAQDDYDCKPKDQLVLFSTSAFAQKRYEYVIPIVFNNVESYKASMLDQTINIIFRGRGKQDDMKAKTIEAAYEYLKQLLDLDSFQISAAHNFFLTGFVTSLASFKNKTREIPIINEETGNVEIGEDGKPLTRVEYLYNDPVISVGEPEKVFFSPDSETSSSGEEKIPYYIQKILMLPEEVKKLYHKKVTPDTKLTDDSNDCQDSERVEVFIYVGKIPEVHKGVIKDWVSDADYFIATTKSKLLYIEQTSQQRWITCQKFYGKPADFFGYGLGKTLHQFQKERSIRRAQIMRIGDLQAYQKWLVMNSENNSVDLEALQDISNVEPVLYEKTPPKLSEQPTINPTVLDLDNKAENESQQTAGMMDISTGGQQTVIKTATGESISAEASERKVRLAKKLFARFYKNSIVKLLKLCQENWDEDKLVQITDESGNQAEVVLTKNSLEGIDFDKDIDFEIESPTLNRDLIRAQSIELYEKMKQSPMVDQNELIKFVFSEGYGKNGDKFLKKNDLQPGMQLMGQDGQSYVVDESGNVVAGQQIQQTDQNTSAGGNGAVPSSLGNYVGANL